MYEKDGGYSLEPDETYHQIAAENISYQYDEYLYYNKTFAAIIVWEAIEELSEYAEDFRIYKLDAVYWIGDKPNLPAESE